MASASMNKIERAHQMYREGYYDEALKFYTEALAMTKTKTQNIALHSNRAACYLKLHDFKKAAEECTSVLELDHKHTGALMLRAQTLVTLKEYQSALFDVKRLIELNPSSEVYQNLQTSLKTQLIRFVFDNFFAEGKSLAPIPESEAEFEGEDEDDAQLNNFETDKEQSEREQAAKIKANQKVGLLINTNDPESDTPTRQTNELLEKVVDGNVSSKITTTTPAQSVQGSLERDPNGWRSIPKPKGHAALDYGRWDRVDDDSSEEDDDEEEDDSQPQYRFRVRTVGVKSVK